MKPQDLQVIVIDRNNFSRSLVGEILRGLNVSNTISARTHEIACSYLLDRAFDIILLSCESADCLESLSFVRQLRRGQVDRVRRIPVILLTAGITRQLVIRGRDAGIDEFLAKPISPAAVRQRLEMVIETPRPFIECEVYIGPSRRRKNPADYYGEKRRYDEKTGQSLAMVDQDELAARQPVRRILAQLRLSCSQLKGNGPGALGTVLGQLRSAKAYAVENHDYALLACLTSFESYVTLAAPLSQVEEEVTTSAISSLEQLAALPVTYLEARSSVAIVFGKTIEKRLIAS